LTDHIVLNREQIQMSARHAKETNETRAQKAAALKLIAAIKGSDPLDKKPPTLREYSNDFLRWVETGRLESVTRS
jgi:hypothetical protein